MKGELKMKVCKCLKCGHELKTQTGIRNHIKKIHKTKPPIKRGVHWDFVSPAASQQGKQIIITPETKFIDVPIILRVSLKIGDVKFVKS